MYLPLVELMLSVKLFFVVLGSAPASEPSLLCRTWVTPYCERTDSGGMVIGFLEIFIIPFSPALKSGTNSKPRGFTSGAIKPEIGIKSRLIWNLPSSSISPKIDFCVFGSASI